jgi:DNA-binding MarR family transcriptional regulator
MTAEHGLLDEARRLSALLISTAEQAKAEFAEEVAAFDLPVHLARTLLVLDKPAPMHELANQLACDRSWITGLADQLEERGLISREPGADRRVKLLVLTDAGRDLRTRMAVAVSARSRLLHRLDPAERTTLEALLRRVRDDEG